MSKSHKFPRPYLHLLQPDVSPRVCLWSLVAPPVGGAPLQDPSTLHTPQEWSCSVGVVKRNGQNKSAVCAAEVFLRGSNFAL